MVDLKFYFYRAPVFSFLCTRAAREGSWWAGKTNLFRLILIYTRCNSFHYKKIVASLTSRSYYFIMSYEYEKKKLYTSHFNNNNSVYNILRNIFSFGRFFPLWYRTCSLKINPWFILCRAIPRRPAGYILS